MSRELTAALLRSLRVEVQEDDREIRVALAHTMRRVSDEIADLFDRAAGRRYAEYDASATQAERLALIDTAMDDLITREMGGAL